MSRTGILSLIVILGVAALIWFGMSGMAAAECEICMTWQGERRCQVGQGSDEAAAIDRARTAICQLLTHSREDNIACGRQDPDSVECK
jgi:hypothetical protein